MEYNPSWRTNAFSVGQEIPTFYENQWFITVFTTFKRMSLSCAKSIQSTPPFCSFIFHFIIIHPLIPRSDKVSYNEVPAPKTCVRFSSPIRATRPAHFIAHDLLTRTIYSLEYKPWSSSLCNFLHFLPTSSFLSPSIHSTPHPHLQVRQPRCIV